MAKEIEVKYRLLDPGKAERVLAGRGIVLGAAVTQDDQAFAPVGWKYGEAKLGRVFARLRTEGGQHFFTVKRPERVGSLEYECGVADREVMAQAIVAMGYYATTRIVKTRRTGKGGDFYFCLDEVEGLGSFLEVEQLVGDEVAAEGIYSALEAFADGLGLEMERVREGYEVLMWRATEAA